MEAKDRKVIDNCAEKVHEIIFGISTDYTNLEHFLELRGIDVRYIDSENIDGYLRWDNNTNCPVIAVSIVNEAPVRRRFTMAHELGHLILDYKWKFNISFDQVKNEGLKLGQKEVLNVLSYRGKDNYTQEERQKEEKANEFAAAFLIPNNKLRPMILKAIEKNQDGASLVNDTAITFCTSTETAKIRLKNYLAFDIMSK